MIAILGRGRTPLNAGSRYTHTAIVLHWLIAALVIINVVLAWSFDFWPDAYAQSATDTHKSFGIFVLGLAVVRLLWRLGHPPPPFPRKLPRWERLGVRTVHIALYVMIFGMPLSGWLYDSAWKDAPSYPIHFFGLFDMPRIGFIAHLPSALKEKVDAFFGTVHVWTSYVLYGLFLGHVVGALKRQFRDKEPELQRMMFSGND